MLLNKKICIVNILINGILDLFIYITHTPMSHNVWRSACDIELVAKIIWFDFSSLKSICREHPLFFPNFKQTNWLFDKCYFTLNICINWPPKSFIQQLNWKVKKYLLCKYFVYTVTDNISLFYEITISKVALVFHLWF